MRQSGRGRELTAGLTTILLVVTATTLCAAEPAAKRWQADLVRFAKEDRENPPPSEPILFVGSSSIRLWDLKKHFPNRQTLNRGFGGSQAADTLELAERIVLPYRPSAIVFYAGDNDIAQEKSPEQVAADVADVLKQVRAALPTTRMLYLAIKPSTARWERIASIRRANALVEQLAQSDALFTFVDVHTPLLGNDGLPDARLFQADKLHLNEEGYTVWTKVVSRALDERAD